MDLGLVYSWYLYSVIINLINIHSTNKEIRLWKSKSNQSIGFIIVLKIRLEKDIWLVKGKRKWNGNYLYISNNKLNWLWSTLLFMASFLPSFLDIYLLILKDKEKVKKGVVILIEPSTHSKYYWPISHTVRGGLHL